MAAYALDLSPRKKHVFVTQLDNDEESHEMSIIKIPIVNQKRGQLLKQGVNTLQSTLLLRKNAELAVVQAELDEKRKTFRTRIDNCHRKEEELIRKQELIKEKITSFEKFVADNNAKKQRAMVKYQQEHKHKERKMKELQDLNKELTLLVTTLTSLQKKVSTSSKYCHFLEQVLKKFPEDSILSRDATISTLIRHQETLNSTNVSLKDKLDKNTQQIEQQQQQLQIMMADHANNLLVYGKQLASSQQHLESLSNNNAKLEESTINARLAKRKEGEETGQIKLAIENIADKCGATPNGEQRTYLEKLDAITKFIADRERVLTLVNDTSPSSGGRIPFGLK